MLYPKAAALHAYSSLELFPQHFAWWLLDSQDDFLIGNISIVNDCQCMSHMITYVMSCHPAGSVHTSTHFYLMSWTLQRRSMSWATPPSGTLCPAFLSSVIGPKLWEQLTAMGMYQGPSAVWANCGTTMPMNEFFFLWHFGAFFFLHSMFTPTSPKVAWQRNFVHRHRGRLLPATPTVTTPERLVRPKLGGAALQFTVFFILFCWSLMGPSSGEFDV